MLMAANNNCHSTSSSPIIDSSDTDTEVNIRSRTNSTSDQQKQPDTEILEQIVTCPIHLGILKDPRKLSCQHAFCRICLNNLLQYYGKIVCPTCRKEENPNLKCAEDLPRALCESQLVEVIMRDRLKREEEDFNSDINYGCIDGGSPASYRRKRLTSGNRDDNVSGVYQFNDICGNSSTSLTNSREILPHGRVSDDVSHHPTNSMLQSLQSCDTIVGTRRNSTAGAISTQMITSNFSNIGSTYDMMDIETIRENMLTYSDYKLVRRNRVKKICKSLNSKKTVEEAPEFHTFDVSIKDHMLVLVCSNTSKFLAYSETESRSFHVNVDNNIFHAVYIRVHNGDLYATGYYQSGANQNWIFIQANMHGKIIRQTENYTQQIQGGIGVIDLSGNIDNIMLGFDVNFKSEQFYVCFPKRKSVQVFNISLIEQTHYFQFDHNYPEYVAFYPQHNQLWISCPFNKRILIVELNNGAYRQFQTEQISRATPTFICCTDDEKIIFLDSSTNRFIWIKRRHDYILTQKLNLRSINSLTSTIPNINNENSIRNFQTLPAGMLIVNTNHEVTLFQPARINSRNSRNHTPCVIL